MKSNVLFSLVLLAILAAIGLPQTAETSPQAFIETMTISPDQWAAGSGFGYALTDGGLQATEAGFTAVYTSAPLAAPFPFNAVVPSWQADLPEGVVMELAVRTAVTPDAWSDWFDIHAHDDWNEPGAVETAGEMIAVPAADETHQFLQFRLTLTPGTAVRPPMVAQLAFTFIDTSDGPTIAEMQAQQAELEAAQGLTAVTDGFPRPSVISRPVWCIYDTCDDIEDLVYEPVTHLIVHHTVTDNGYANAASVVRAIYLYHRDNREWGDIGYNYLIDRDGNVFEGHMNEDYLNLDVVGTHAAAANSGSLGVSLIGTFTTPDEYQASGEPSVAMRHALADLFAWKADQRNIDVYDASRPVYMNWGLPHVMGHRDVYGGTGTLCPGGNAQTLLPWLREAIIQRTGQAPAYTFVSETSPAFTRSNAYWREAPQQCGWQGHAYYTWSTTDPSQSTNWGEWQLAIPQAGVYEIEVYAPYCYTANSETQGATYEIRHQGNVLDTAVVSHEANVGLWMSLGAFALPGGPGTTLYLSDLTNTDSGVGVWFDDVRFRLVTQATATNLQPDGNLVNQSLVDFTWEIDAPTAVATTTWEIATTPSFTEVLASASWPTAVISHSHTFSQDYPALYWRITLHNNDITVFVSPPAGFVLDATPPESAVTELRHHVMAGYYDVVWQGSDNLSGLTSYDIEYRAETEPDWTTWLTGVTTTTAVFTPPDPDALYWFRSQASDAAGNVEAAGVGDIRSDQATIIFNPAVRLTAPGNGAWLNDLSVPVSWQIEEITAVQTSTLHVATDNQFNQLVMTATLPGPALTHTLAFSQEYPALYWRVRVDFTPPLPGLTATVTSEPGYFGLDTTPPTSGVTAVYTITNHAYLITWQGEDALAGVATYNIDYREAGSPDWSRWLTDTINPGGLFMPPTPGLVYELRSQATDSAGNQEAPHPTADIATDQAIPIPHAIMLPVIQKE